MGTRCGDIDPAIIGFLAEHANLSLQDIDHQLNTQSGLLDPSWQTSDIRQLLQAVHEQQDHRAGKYLGTYLATLGGADAVVFEGGIGERARTSALESVRKWTVAVSRWIALEISRPPMCSLERRFLFITSIPLLNCW